MEAIALAVHYIQLWFQVFLSTFETVEGYIVGAFIASFDQETCVFVFPAYILLYEVCYVQLKVPAVRKGTAFNGYCSIRSAALRYPDFIQPVSSCIIPCNTFVLPLVYL